MRAIKKGYKICYKIYKIEQRIRIDAMSSICRHEKGCSHVYTLFQSNEKKECKSLSRWKSNFNIDENAWHTYSI